MKNSFTTVSLLLLLGLCGSAAAQRITITVAGTDAPVSGASGTIAKYAGIGYVSDVCLDNNGTVYFANGLVKKISKEDGRIINVGSGTYLTRDAGGNILMSDGGVLRRYDISTGLSSVFAGVGGGGYSGDGGPATSASITAKGVCSDLAGNIYFADNVNNVIRKITATTGIITTVAGNGTSGYSGNGGPATMAALSAPNVVCCDNSGNVYFADQNGTRVRRIDAVSGIITLFAGTGTMASGDGGIATLAGVGHVTGITLSNTGNICLDDESCSTREIDSATNIIGIIAGNLTAEGYNGDEGNSLAKLFHSPQGLFFSNDNSFYVADKDNKRVRKVIQPTSRVSFAYGQGQTILACAGVSKPLNSILSVVDLDGTITWTIVQAPAQGVLTGLPASTPAGGANLTAVTSSYTANAGYIGMDTFRIRVTDGTYADTATIHVVVTAAPVVTASGPVSMCRHDTGTFIGATSGGSIAWSSSSTSVATINPGNGRVYPVAGGTTVISYTADNVSCAVSATNTLTVIPYADPGVITGLDRVCAGSSTTYSSTTPGGIWSALSNRISVSATGVVTGLMPGADAVLYMVSNVCGPAQSNTDIIVDDCGTTAVVTSGLSSVSVYPNPVKDVIYIARSNVAEAVSITLMDITGKIVVQKVVTSPNREISLDVAGLAEGMYILSVKGDKVNETRKVIISR